MPSMLFFKNQVVHGCPDLLIHAHSAHKFFKSGIRDLGNGSMILSVACPTSSKSFSLLPFALSRFV